MKWKMAFWTVAGVALLVALSPGAALAQETGGAEAAVPVAMGLRWIAAGVGMAIAAGLCGLGQARAIASACEGIARNPGAGGTIRVTMILGLAFIESLTLFTLVIIFAKV